MASGGLPVSGARAWIPASDPRLARPGDHALARQTLAAYEPRTAAQAAERTRILAFLDRHPDALERSCAPGHLTASALVLDARLERGLLTLHRKLGRWLQLGGHCDGDGNLARAALREAREESGIEDLQLLPDPVDLDVHVIPARPGEPAHLHLDTRFFIRAPEGAVATVSEESDALAWFSPSELEGVAVDESVRRLFVIRSRTPWADSAHGVRLRIRARSPPRPGAPAGPRPPVP